MEPIKRNVKFFDALRQDSKIKGEIKHAVNKVIDSGVYSDGNETQELEKQLAYDNGVNYCVLTGSGTIALEITIRSLGLKKVLTVSNSFYATASAIISAGAQPVFVDTDKNCLMDLDAVAETLTNDHEIDSVLAVNLYGNLINLTELQQMCDRYSIPLLIDGAQNAWCKFNNRSTASYARAEATSFYTTKSLGAYGEAGAILTNDEEIYKFAKSYRNHGRALDGYYHGMHGVNGRIDEIQSAILRTKLKFRDNYIIERRELLQEYEIGFCMEKNILLNWNHENNFIVPYVFPIFVENRDKLKAFLFSQGIQTVAHYPLPIHLQPSMEHLGYKLADFPNTEKQAAQTLSLPFYANMNRKDIIYICDKVIEFLEKT